MYACKKEFPVANKGRRENTNGDESMEYNSFLTAPQELLEVVSVMSDHSADDTESHRYDTDTQRVLKVAKKEINFPDELNITLGELTRVTLPVGTVLYKSMRYENFDVDMAISGQENKEEWEGQYFALDKSISEGYETDYLDEDTGDGIVWIHTFEVTKEITTLHNTARLHGSDEYSGNHKAAAIKYFLIHNPGVIGGENAKKINYEGNLMPTLSRIGIAFNGAHDMEGGREIIIGGEQLKNIKIINSEPHKYKMWMRV